MTKLCAALMFALCALQPVLAADGPASEASIRQLVEVMQSRKLLDSAASQIDAMMQTSLKQAMAGQTLTAEEQKILDDMRTQVIAIFAEDMKWDVLQPIFVDVYRQSFTQSEVDGMLAFYKTPAGQAVIRKMPAVMQNTMTAMQRRAAVVMPRMQQVQQEAMNKLQALRASKAPASP